VAGLAQPGPQSVVDDDQTDDGGRDRSQQRRQGVGEVAFDGAGAGGAVQCRRLVADPRDPVLDELEEERVEVGEVAVQDALGAAGLGGQGPAGQGARPVAEQDPFGRVEELLPYVADGGPCRHAAFLGWLVGACPLEWAYAHCTVLAPPRAS
jgi:hypothetical protein